MDIKKSINIKLGKKVIQIKLLYIIGGVAALAVILVALLLLLNACDKTEGSSAESNDSVFSEEASELSAESASAEIESEESETSSCSTENESSEESSFGAEESSAYESFEESVSEDQSNEQSESLGSETESSEEKSEMSEESTETNSTESDTPPAESQTPPAESETPPAESQTPPAESETPPAESQTPPAESETPPAESQTPPAESETPPAESQTPPAESETPPAESQTPPAESETPPAESQAPPVETEPPVEDSSEDESSVIIDMDAPMNPLPDTLMTDPIDSYFNDSVFVGYSIMMHFGRYISEWHSEIDASIMGNPLFYAGVGVSFYRDRTDPSAMPLYQGNTYSFSELPTATGKNTIYIGLMGYSDVRRSGVDGAYIETVSGIQRILSANPNVNLVILACTYNTGEYSNSLPYSVNNGNILRYNNMVLDYCTSIGVDFVDVATPQTTYRGYLPMEYSSDEEYHIAKKAFYLWVDVLRDYAKKKQAGTWQNMTDMPSLPAFS